MPLTELILVNEHYDYRPAFLLMPEALRPWERDEDENPTAARDRALREGRFRS